MAFTTNRAVEFLALIAPVEAPPRQYLPGPYVPDMPDLVAVVTQEAAPGETNEGVFEQIAYQVRTRGGPNDQDGVEAATANLVLAVRRFGGPITVGGHVIQAAQVINGPQALPGSPDNGRRFEQVVTVLITVATNL